MKYLIVKDKKKRNNLQKKELNNLSFKAFNRENFLLNDIWAKNLNDELFPNFIKFYKNRMSFLFTRNNNKELIQIRNRCVVSGKSRSVSRRYKMSRIALRDAISKGLLVGVKKKSW
jgi:ribosomal protein S14